MAANPVRRLEDHRRARLGRDARPAAPSRSRPERGRKPSTTNRGRRQPGDHERRRASRSAPAPLRPAARRRRTRARAARRGRRCPASRRRSRTRPGRPPRICSTSSAARATARCARARRSAAVRAGTPACVSSARVRRVSSAAMTSASRSASTARGERSPRLPIGVATSTSAPSFATACTLAHSRPRCCRVRSAPRANAPAAASTTNSSPPDHRRHAPRPQRDHSQHPAVGRAERDVDRRTASRSCAPGDTAATRARRRYRSRPSSPRRARPASSRPRLGPHDHRTSSTAPMLDWDTGRDVTR